MMSGAKDALPAFYKEARCFLNTNPRFIKHQQSVAITYESQLNKQANTFTVTYVCCKLQEWNVSNNNYCYCYCTLYFPYRNTFYPSFLFTISLCYQRNIGIISSIIFTYKISY